MTVFNPQVAHDLGYQLIPSEFASRGTATIYGPAGMRGEVVSGGAVRTLVFVHPLDAIAVRFCDDPIADLQHALAWLVQDAIRRFDARTRFREATGR